MPLSEHEQRQLEQIEQALYAEYPKFAQAVRAQDPRVHYKRRVVQAAIGFLLGVGLLLAGVVSKFILVGVAGFLVMLACAMWALTSWRHMTGAPRRAAARPGSAGAGTGGPGRPGPRPGSWSGWKSAGAAARSAGSNSGGAAGAAGTRRASLVACRSCLAPRSSVQSAARPLWRGDFPSSLVARASLRAPLSSRGSGAGQSSRRRAPSGRASAPPG